MSFNLANKDGRAVLVRDGGIFDLERHTDENWSSDPMAAIARHGELHAVAAGLPAAGRPRNFQRNSDYEAKY